MRFYLKDQNTKNKNAYHAQPNLIHEHAGIEEAVLAGGYGYRQILELIQNGADAILESPVETTDNPKNHRIYVLLRGSCLYVANTGAPLSKKGLDALLLSHISPKRSNQIGRFGLGFKSLLGIASQADILSQKWNGFIRFDPEKCKKELAGEFGVRVQEAPGLRLAWFLKENDKDDEAILQEMAWAETIVRVAIRQDQGTLATERLQQEIENFRAEFLLFFPVSVALMLDDGQNPARMLTVEPDNGVCLLHDGDKETIWQITEHVATIQDERAVNDATHLHARDEVPIIWAYPQEDGREDAGAFWAFFPTNTPTYLPGILNAPWKLNSDRNSIIGGEWNTALMREAASMIANALPQLSTMDDPGQILDAFPRQLERKEELAAPLVEALWKILAKSAVIPDGLGALRPATDMWCHPCDNAEIANHWADLAADAEKTKLIHASCLAGSRGYRNSRLQELARRLLSLRNGEKNDKPGLKKMEPSDWFQRVASVETKRALEVLRLAASYHHDCKPEVWKAVRNTLAIIPSDNDELLAADKVVLAPEGATIPDGRHPVAQDLANMEESKSILGKVMGVKPLDDDIWDAVLQESIPAPLRETAGQCDRRWTTFWQLLRKAPKHVSSLFCQRETSRMRVKRCDGQWDRPENVLLPGTLVHRDEVNDNRGVLVDEDYHCADGERLRDLGISDMPQNSQNDYPFEWFWISCDLYLNKLPYCSNSGSTPQRARLVAKSTKMPPGWHLFNKLSEMPSVRLTHHLITCLKDNPPYADKPSIEHNNPALGYPSISVNAPLLFVLRNYGRLKIADAVVGISTVLHLMKYEFSCTVGPIEPFLPQLKQLAGIDAVYVTTPTAEEIARLWRAIIGLHSHREAYELGFLWEAAARDGIVPYQIYCCGKVMPLNEVYVTESEDRAKLARDQRLPVCRLEATACSLWKQHGALDLDQQIKTTWEEQIAPDALLVSILPEISEALITAARDSLRGRLVRGLGLNVAGSLYPFPCLMQPDAILLDPEQSEALSRTERWRRMLEQLNSAGQLDKSVADALNEIVDAEAEKRRDHVKAGASLAQRLLRAVGNHREPLLQALGNLGDLDFIGQCPPERLAEAVLWLLGTATLATIKSSLEDEGLKPPKRWSTDIAREFVTSIGFPASYAISSAGKLDPELHVSGPIHLPNLHDYQEEVLQGIQHLIASGTGRRRAIVSLPTGGGKTLVTVQAAVEHVLKSKSINPCVLWIAQTEELCEQAVQAFQQVWVNKGEERQDLRIIRLWGGNPNPTVQDKNCPVVAIATIQTLNNRIGTQALNWIQTPGLVVIDECHHATTKSYTHLLRWLGAETQRRDALEKNEPTLIGLSATPFRVDDEESERLAKRFDARWFPENQKNLYQQLLARKVLAQPRDEALETHVGLTSDEIEALNRIPEPWDSQMLDLINALEKINQRLANDTGRNDILLRQIAEAKERHILFFTNSVSHAEEMAIRLNLQGVPAAAISGGTDRSARRDFLARFQCGELRVLCNHSVLTTGFDAPKTDMILISRTVFSPVRYMQMVGRGLRGVKNGGTETCRIVTVLDNLGRFKDRHPYHYCHQYFETLRGRSGMPTVSPA